MQCTAVDVSIVSMLLDNPPEVTKSAAEILVKLIGNVIRDPSNLKFRSVRLANPVIESKLLVASGAFEILFSVGFEEVSFVSRGQWLSGHAWSEFSSLSLLWTELLI